MAVKHKQKQAGNSYYLRNRVEIPIEIQAEDGTFLDEFSPQPSAGQVLSSSESSDTDTSGTYWGTVCQKSIDGSDFSDSQTKVKRFKTRSSERVSKSRKESEMSDQTFINDRILSQLDAINKKLDAIENPSVSVSASVCKLHTAPRCKKQPVKTADSNLKLDGSVKNLDVNFLDLKSIRQDRYIQVEERIQQLSGLDKKGTEQINSQRGGGADVYVKQRVKWPHEYVLAGNTKDCIAYNQLNTTLWMAGFYRIMREEKYDESKNCMLDYLIALLDDANDFSWQNQLRPAMPFCCVEWSRVRYPIGQKLTK